ncbi:MAG: TIGR03663 family protein, partial [Halobacteriales archaeon]
MSRPRGRRRDEAARRLRGALARPVGTVAVIVAVALALRLPLLGDRPVHWDEARVGWSILHYRATGIWEYRPVLHGPFLFHVGRRLVGAFGASMAALRLPTALVGGVLPATALWY